MRQLKMFIRSFMLPTGLLLAAILWTGCVQPNLPVNDKPCSRPKVIAFTANWCAPCQRDKATLVQVEAMGVEVQVVDIDANPELAKKYGVTAVPTYFVSVCGKSLRRTNDISVIVAIMKPLFRR